MDSITTFAGNLTDDPKLNYTPKGTPILELTVAVNRRTKNSQGEWVDAPATYKPVKVIGKQAEHVADSATKGTRVLVQAAEETRAYVNKANENKTFTYHLVSDYFGEIGISTKFSPAESKKTTRTNTVSVQEASQAIDGDPWGVQEPEQL